MSAYRRQGIGTAMVRRLLDRVPGQHVGLQADDAEAFYASLGFRPQPPLHVRYLRQVAGQRGQQSMIAGPQSGSAGLGP